MTTDFHTHILPGVDDGSASVEESLELLAMEAAQGITHVVATPHFVAMEDTPGRFLDSRAQAAQQLRTAMAGQEKLPALTLGAEVYYFRGMSSVELLPELAIGDTGYILVEMPPSPWPEAAWQELENIYTRQGLTPVIAHVDRYITPLRQHRIPERLSSLPVLVQANGSFFLRPRTRRMAMGMLRKGQIQLLGSDCHNLTGRPPNLEAVRTGIQTHLGAEALAYLAANEAAVLSGQPLF